MIQHPGTASRLDSASPYELLQSWYLARLRTNVEHLSQRVQLTPLGRIDRDRASIERMVTGAIKPLKQPAVESKTRPWLFATWTFFVLLLPASGYLSGSAIAAAVGLVAGICFTLLMVWIRSNDAQIRQRRLRTVSDYLRGQGIDLPPLRDASGDDMEDAFVEALLEKFIRENSIADCSPNLLLAVDRNLHILCANLASISLLDYAPQELQGMTLTDLIVFPVSQEVIKLIDASTSAEPVHLEVSCRSKFGRVVDLAVTVERSSQANMLFTELVDVTARKTLDRARSQFVATISHDVRTPLQSALFTLECLETASFGPLTEEASRSVRRVNRNINEVLDLVSELIDFEQTRVSHIVLQKASVDLQKITNDLVDELRDYAAKRSITIRSLVPSIKIEADQKRLRRILLNLISNAIKFSPPRSDVTIDAEVLVDGLRINVSDKGAGILKQNAAAIFEPYFQSNDGHHSQQDEWLGGSGLGLAICKAFVEAHGGMIGVKSEPGHGSLFWFSLPNSPSSNLNE